MIVDIIITVLLAIGTIFTLVGSIGLLKLDDPMSRLHAPTKASTLGVGSLLLASIIYAFSRGEPSIHEILVMGFLFVTAPIAGNFIAKVHLHRERGKETLIAPPQEEIWASYDQSEKG